MLLLYLFEFTIHTTISACHMSKYYLLCNAKYVDIIIYKYDCIHHNDKTSKNTYIARGGNDHVRNTAMARCIHHYYWRTLVQLLAL